MAALRLKIRDCLITLVFCLVLSSDILNAQSMPSINDVENWASELSKQLRTDVDYTTGYTILDIAYNNRKDNYQDLSAMSLEFEKLEPMKVVREMAAELGKMLESKMEALNRSVTEAEKAAASHVWKPKIVKDDVNYINTKLLLENDTRFKKSERFGQPIIHNISSVHIPVEIYDGDVEILNGLEWSAKLDKVFKENADRDPEILWQYFGSQTGFMRTLPGSKWGLGPDDVDLYDVRRRPWYTQGSSSPKDMFILIDSSGSVAGKALELVKVAVKSLMDTLGENDFVNIAKFSKTAEFVSSCFNGSFAQATFRNKQILKNDVMQIKANGMADFKAGFNFAFEQFLKLKNESNDNRGAGCNSMIMLFTDGGTDHAEEVFDHYNKNENMSVRVFTYAVGPTANPVSAIRWMACRNRGFFSQIPAMGAIRSKVQSYLDVASRPLAIRSENYIQWTTVYPGYSDPGEYVPVVSRPRAILNQKKYKWGNIYTDVLGLGMMTTVTLPVYNTVEGTKNQTILGVMGIDVTTADMKKREPARKLGPNGYTFATNANGDIVFHPYLRFSTDIKDPPNVDILDIEVESEETDQLRQKMIDGDTGTMTIDTFRISEDQRHVDPETRIYTFMGLGQTNFSLGLSLPVDEKYFLKVSTNIANFDKEKKLLDTTSTGLLIADWDYYKGFLTSVNQTGTITDLEGAIRDPSKYQWDTDLINHLLWDINVTSCLNDYWQAKNQSAGVVATFVGTNGGLTRFHPKTPEDIVNVLLGWRNPWKATYFKRAVSSPRYLFSAAHVLEPDSDPNATANDIMVTKSVTIDNPALSSSLRGDNPDYKAAVLGTIFTHKSIRDRLEKATTSMMAYDCRDVDYLGCYLLDDGAFLISTNQENSRTSVGRFFGKVDPEIMFHLYNDSVYLRLEQNDYQATCPVEDDDLSSAGTLSFHIPSLTLLYELLTFNWWSSVVTWMFANLNLMSLFASQENFAEAYIPPEDTVACVKKVAQYYYNPDIQNWQGTTECEIRNLNCSRNAIAVRLAKTNLLLVVTELEMTDCEPCRLMIPNEELIQEPVKTTPNTCNVPPRYRRPTEACYDFDEREDATKCAGCLATSLSQMTLCLIAVVSLLLAQR